MLFGCGRTWGLDGTCFIRLVYGAIPYLMVKTCKNNGFLYIGFPLNQSTCCKFFYQSAKAPLHTHREGFLRGEFFSAQLVARVEDVMDPDWALGDINLNWTKVDNIENYYRTL